MIDDIKNSKPGEWYSKLKRISRYDQGKSEFLQVEEISHLSDLEQAERIASKQADISNTYKSVQLEDIQIPPFSAEDIPQFRPDEVKEYIMKLKSKKSTAPGDIPVKIIKEFAHQISFPLSDIINLSLLKGKWANCYKKRNNNTHTKGISSSKYGYAPTHFMSLIIQQGSRNDNCQDDCPRHGR